jgi:carbonic anhydrase
MTSEAPEWEDKPGHESPPPGTVTFPVNPRSPNGSTDNRLRRPEIMNAMGVARMAVGVFAAGWTGLVFAQHWSYSGEAGPDNWSKLDEAFVMCGLGQNQSPIDLDGFVESEMGPLKLDYRAGAMDILSNGHAVQVDYRAGSTLTVHGRRFELKQFHFHTPSENHVRGQSFPLEAHLVHADANGTLAVVSVLFGEGSPNPLLAELWKQMPGAVGEKMPLPAHLNVNGLLPKSRDYYRYNGSLTTPPCSEGVLWMVMKEPATVSRDQVEKVASVLGFANNRPLQPANARPILQ